MDLSYVISWMVGAFLVNQWLRSFQHPIYVGRSWRLICPALGMVMGIVGWKWADLLAPVSSLLFLSFIVLPNLGAKAIGLLLHGGRFTLPTLLAHGLRWLHPGDGLWDLPALIKILKLWSIDKSGEAETIWKGLPQDRIVQQRYSFSLVFQIAGAFWEWEKILGWSRKLKSGNDSWIELYIPVVEIRALGELGRFSEQISELEAYLLKRPPQTYAATATLFVSAFQGRVSSVEALIQEELRHLPKDTRGFWKATALQYAGCDEEAERAFRELHPSAEPRTKRAIERRLNETALPADPAFTARLERIETQIRQSFTLPQRRSFPYSTYLIGVILVVVYGIEEWMGGSTNHGVLYRLGASIPEALFFENSWRLLAAGFLHFGAIHLLLNLVGLKLLGPFVEALLGQGKFLALYLFCIVISMAGVSALGLAGLIAPELMVGASGGIMGLVGYLTAYFFAEWLDHRSTANRQRVQGLLVALAIQVAFDLSTENVSFAGHAAGAFAGLAWGVVGMFFKNRGQKKWGARG